VPIFLGNYTEANKNNLNPDLIPWIDDGTKSFYNILRTSSSSLFAKGLLYSTGNASYAKIKVQMCNYTNPEAQCKN
jgi:tRNA isopentenyl-2-thiomethyl-A-37 hydroxylase MiaE